MAERSQAPVPLSQVLARVGERAGLGRSALEAGRLWSSWRTIVGDAVAAHAQPSSLREGVLRIRADSPVWATEVGYLAETIRARTNEVLGRDVVAEVRVWTGPRERVDADAETAERPPSRVDLDEARSTDPTTAFARARKAWRRRVEGRR